MVPPPPKSTLPALLSGLNIGDHQNLRTLAAACVGIVGPVFPLAPVNLLMRPRYVLSLFFSKETSAGRIHSRQHQKEESMLRLQALLNANSE